MSLAFAGGSHRTVPIELREKLAFSSEQATEALVRFRKQFPGSEAVLLSTCNRIELYAADEERRGPPPPDELAMFLAECRGVDPINAGKVLGGVVPGHASLLSRIVLNPLD